MIKDGWLIADGKVGESCPTIRWIRIAEIVWLQQNGNSETGFRYWAYVKGVEDVLELDADTFCCVVTSLNLPLSPSRKPSTFVPC